MLVKGGPGANESKEWEYMYIIKVVVPAMATRVTYITKFFVEKINIDFAKSRYNTSVSKNLQSPLFQ